MSVKLSKNAAGETIVKISESDWLAIGESQGWTKTAAGVDVLKQGLSQLSQAASALSAFLNTAKQANNPRTAVWVNKISACNDSVRFVIQQMDSVATQQQPQQQPSGGFGTPANAPAQPANAGAFKQQLNRAQPR